MTNALKNSIRLVGHLGMDPEIRNFENDKLLARFSLATHESYKNDKGERIEETQWHHLILWDAQARYAREALKKGDEIAIEGKLVNRTYVNKEGLTRFVCEIVVNELLKFSK